MKTLVTALFCAYAAPAFAGSVTDIRYIMNWQTVEADNGRIYKVRMDSIARGFWGPGSAEVHVYTPEGESTFYPPHLHRFAFDCRGHYSDIGGPLGWYYAPPRSVIGVISAMVCAPKSKTRSTPTAAESKPVNPSSQGPVNPSNQGIELDTE